VNLTLSPQIRIVAGVGLVLVIIAAGYSMLLGRSGPAATDTTKVIVHRHAGTTHKTTSVTVKKHGSKTTVVKTSHTAKTPTHSHVVTKSATTVVHTKKHTAVASGNLVYSDLPAPLQWQLARHHIVVVSIYSADANVDSISVAEAQAGAAKAGAGFLLVNVLDNALAGPLTALLPGGGLLPDPGILIYRSPGNIALRIDGFVDRDAVAQAVANAFSGENGPLTASTAAAATDPTDTTYTPPSP
jgi:hypothetical protein